MREIKITCDNCGKQKQQANDWYRIGTTAPDRLVICSIDSPAPPSDWVAFDVCGQDCALQCTSRFLSTGKIERT